MPRDDRTEGRATARRSAFRFGFVAGLPVFWIAMADVVAVVPWELPRALVVVYLLHVGMLIGLAFPRARRTALGALALGIVAGLPRLWLLWGLTAIPLLIVWLCIWFAELLDRLLPAHGNRSRSRHVKGRAG
jgi:hypothetical protein